MKYYYEILYEIILRSKINTKYEILLRNNTYYLRVNKRNETTLLNLNLTLNIIINNCQ